MQNWVNWMWLEFWPHFSCSQTCLGFSHMVRNFHHWAIYSRVQNSIERLFWARNQGNHQIFEKNDTSYETQGCFHWKKNQNQIQNGRLKKTHFPALPILNIFLQKFNGLVHTNALCINQLYKPKTNPWHFREKILRLGGAGKWAFFTWPFWFFFQWKQPWVSCEVSFFSKFWWLPWSWSFQRDN